jgi:hypothetical protein
MTGQGEPGAYLPFRERLDAVLRTRDPERVRAFLIEQGQWSEADQGDSAFAMWMMIAGSPSLVSLHEEAERWLREHGHEDEAQIIAGSRRRASGGQRRSGVPRANQPARGQHGQAHRGGRRRGRDGQRRHDDQPRREK